MSTSETRARVESPVTTTPDPHSQPALTNRPASISIADPGNGDEGAETDSHLSGVESSLSAWLCVFGGFIFLIPSYGFMQSIGTVQTYLQLNQLHEYSTSNIGWITGTYTFLGTLLTLQIGPLYDEYGPEVLGPVGVAVTIASFFLLAECKTYWQFMLCLGVLGALGAAIMAIVAITTAAKLFVRRRGLAMGMALTGSSVGSIIFPIVLRSTLPNLGWRWSMRILGFILTGLLTPGLLCFLPFRRLIARLPGNRQQKRGHAIVNFAPFRSPAFSFVTAGIFLLEFAIFGLSGLLPTIATGAGFSPEDAYTLLAIIGASSCVGRILPGMAGDIAGSFNVLLVCIASTVVCMGVLFVPFATTSQPVLYAFSALWGFGSGSFLSITPVCVGKTCEPKDYGRFYGTMNCTISFSLLLSIPLNGMMLEHMGAQALAGLLTVVVFLAGVCYVAARALLIGQWLALKEKI